MQSWLRHVLLLKRNRRSEIWVVVGAQGFGKTSTVNGMVEEMKKQGLKVTTKPALGFDVWHIDDGGRFFSKRFWQSKTGKLVSRFVQIIRELFTLTIITVPSLEMLDISFRESEIVEVIQVVKPGLAIWREPIIVKPIWQDESWRTKYLKEMNEVMEEMV